LQNQGLTRDESGNVISVLYVNDELARPAIQIASSLRDQGFVVDIDLVGRPFKKQMENASESKYAIIVAPKEYASNQVIIKNMSSGKEQSTALSSLLSDAKSFFSL
jgi:histidyl-tRNA synthetase